MSSDVQKKSSVNTAGQAMNVVLKAEQDAEHSIAECRKTARQTIQDAQQHAALIARRTNERITMLHLRCKQTIAHRTSEMERSAAKELLDVHGADWHEEKLTGVVDKLAADLIGTTRPSDK
jgi:vacuolar-type H+-ATPase subunit H